jgi:hemerythrin-like domain-containing protein
MASHGRRGLTGALLGSVTTKLLRRATIPVLVAAVESNLPALSDEQRAQATIRDEHRSLAAVLHALLGQAERGDAALLRAMLFYVEQFPERLHHPKEDEHLFRRLRARTAECDALLDELEQQHRDGAARFAVLRGLLQGSDRAAFAQAVRNFAELEWRHMRAEETLVLPAASAHLTADDWRAIAAAFESNADPGFGDESFEPLAARLLELAGKHRP